MGWTRDSHDYPGGMRGTFSFTAKREPLFDFGEAIEKLTAQVKELEAYKKDIENACKMAMDEQCSLDQKHCTCVPLLREKVKELEDRVQKQSTRIRAFGYGWQEGDKTRIQELEEKNEKLRDIASDAYDWAVLHGIEMRSGIWHRLKRELKP